MDLLTELHNLKQAPVKEGVMDVSVMGSDSASDAHNRAMDEATTPETKE